jgi:hypothetical protein
VGEKIPQIIDLAGFAFKGCGATRTRSTLFHCINAGRLENPINASYSYFKISIGFELAALRV